MRGKLDSEGMITCLHCRKHYKPELSMPPGGDPRPLQKIYPNAEPYQLEQLMLLGICSDKCFDEYIGVKHKYTYDEKGRRFKDGKRLLYAEAPE